VAWICAKALQLPFISNYPPVDNLRQSVHVGPPAVLHRLNSPAAGCNGVERRVDPIDGVLPALSVALASRQENKDEQCLQGFHAVIPQWLR